MLGITAIVSSDRASVLHSIVEVAILLKALCVISLLLCSVNGFAASHRRATVPLFVEGNRLFVDVQFQRRNGTARMARLWLDTGDPDFRIAESLAKDLGLELSSTPINGEDGKLIPVQLPPARIGTMPIQWGNAKPMVVAGNSSNAFAGSHTEGNLPSTVLMQYQVVLDLPERRLTLAEPATLHPFGIPSDGVINDKTGMVQIAARINGNGYSLALDSGAPYSMISADLMKQWATQHPEWPQSTGAVGPANLLFLPGLEQSQMLRVPEMDWGPLLLRDVRLGSLPVDFVSWYSGKTTAPVAGFLATNVLDGYRILIDYPVHKVYFEKRAEMNTREMNVVGIIVVPARAGGYVILGAAKKNGRALVVGVQRGDKLLQIDGLSASRMAPEQIIALLHGKPGDTRTLLIQRDGRHMEIRARITHIL